MRRSVLVLALVAFPLAAAGKKPKEKHLPAPPRWPPLGLEEPKAPADNPQTPEKAALGRQLFWDARLSKSGTMSCESCHHPDKGWADGQKLSKKDDGKMNTRHTPTLLNAALAPHYYWDGRAPTLEKQIYAAWKAQMGAGLADDKWPEEVAKRLGEIAGYKEAFRKVFNEAPTRDNVPKALAAYLRTLLSGDSAWDRAENGDKKAYTAAQKRGAELFKTRAKCSLCHVGSTLASYEFKNIGIGMEAEKPDSGRAGVKDPADKTGKKTLGDSDPKLVGAFRVPSLRSVSKSPPYMHDGRFTTLAEVVDYFGKPIDNPSLDEKMKGGVTLADAEKKDLIAFLKALDGSEPDGTKPTLP